MLFGTRERIFGRKVLPQSAGSNFTRRAADTFESLVHVYQNIRDLITEDRRISNLFMHKNLDSVNIFVIKRILRAT